MLTLGQENQRRAIAQYDLESAMRYEIFCKEGCLDIVARVSAVGDQKELRSPKLCQECGNLFSPTDKMPTRAFLLRASCSEKCAIKLRVKARRETISIENRYPELFKDLKSRLAIADTEKTARKREKANRLLLKSIICDKCSHSDPNPYGFTDYGIRRYFCKACKKTFINHRDQ